LQHYFLIFIQSTFMLLLVYYSMIASTKN